MLIAMSVLVLSISATILLFPGIQSGSVDTVTNAEALGVAQKMLENEQALSRKDFKLVVATTSQETIGGLIYTKTIDAVSTDYFTKKITATVTWGGMYLRTQKVVLSGIVTDFQNVIGGDTCDSIVSDNWVFPQVTTKTLGAQILGDASGVYPITDLDAYRKRLYVTVNNTGTLPSVGPSLPGTAANDGGTPAWANTANARNIDSSYAAVSLGSGQTSSYLKLTNFGFALPADATILGIQVKVVRKASNNTTNPVKDGQVRLIRADGTLSPDTTHAHSTNWPTSDGTDTYGGAADLWNDTTWSAAALNDSDFGVAISAVANGGVSNRTASINYVQITVTYTKQLYVLNISNPTNPSFVKTIGENPLSSGYTAVAIATSTATGDYAYAATNSSSAGHLQVINVGTTPAQVLSTYTIPSAPVVANTIFYKDGYVYLGLANNASGPEFVVVDVHNPLSIPATPIATYEVGAGVNGIYVKNGYAFLGTDAAHRLLVLDLNDLAHPALRGYYDAPGAAPGQGKSMYTVGDTLYFGRYYTSNAPEFAVMDTSSNNPALLGSSDIGTSGNTVGAYGTLVRGSLAFLLTGNATGASTKLQVFNVGNPANITGVSSATLVSPAEPRGLDCESGYIYAASVPATGGNLNKGSISIIKGL